MRRIAGVEVEGNRLVATLEPFQRQEVELVAVVRSAIAAERLELAVGRDVIGEADARLELAEEVVAGMAVRDVIPNAVISALDVGPVFQRRHDRRGRDVIVIGGIVLEIPAQAEIERQPVGRVPIILRIKTELQIVRAHPAARRAVDRDAELQLIRNAVVEPRRVGILDIVEILRAVRRALQRLQRQILCLHADLERVVFHRGVGEIVVKGETLLALVLVG